MYTAHESRVVVLRFYELNGDWLRFSMSWKLFCSSGMQTLFFGRENLNSPKYVCVRRLLNDPLKLERRNGLMMIMMRMIIILTMNECDVHNDDEE